MGGNTLFGTQQDEDTLAKNSSALYVPWFEPGTALLHDHRVLHGISPTTRGSKYSLLFFLDLADHPSSESDGTITVFFENSAHSRCPPVTVRWCGSSALKGTSLRWSVWTPLRRHLSQSSRCSVVKNVEAGLGKCSPCSKMLWISILRTTT